MIGSPFAMPGFVGGSLDRADHIRTSEDALIQAFDDPAAQVLVLEGLNPVWDGTGLVREAMEAGARLADHVLLGLEGGVPVFARLRSGIPHGGAHSAALWRLAAMMSPADMALYGTARSLVDWHARHGFCAVCGGMTMPVKAGWSRQCAICNAEHFPRVDPVTIMLAQYEDRVLIGRQPRFPAGRYSALAGFVEPGETIEEAVARELFEEAGVRASDVRYVMSQPWPFPSSLMIACMARVTSDEIVLDTKELEDAMWVDADGVRAALADDESAPFLAPPSYAVAHHLFLHWLKEQE